MHVLNALLAVAGLSSLAAAAPAFADRRLASVNRHIVGWALEARKSNGTDKSNSNSKNSKSSKNSDDGGNKSKKDKNNNNNNNDNGNIIIIEQTIVEPTVIVVQENLELVTELALIAEQEFSALIQAQLALVQEIEIIKNNIRVNHFLAKFSEVNTVIVSITEVIDVRNAAAPNKRYMVNQQLADNGNSQSTVVVMLTASSPMTVGLPTQSLDLSGLLGAAASALPSKVVASVVSDAAASATAAAASAAANAATFANTTVASSNSSSSSSGQVTSFDPNNPFGQFNQSMILPYGSEAPSLPDGAQIVSDPAAIILPNQGGLLVEDVSQFSQDCAVLDSTSTLFNLQSSVLQAEQIAAQLLSGLSLGASSSINSAAAALLNVASASSVLSVAATTSSSSSAIASETVAVAASASASSVSTAVASVSAASSTAPAATSSATSAAISSAAPSVTSSEAAAADATEEATPASSGAGAGVQIVPVPSATAA